MKVFFAGDTIFPNTKRTVQSEVLETLADSSLYLNLESVLLSKRPINSDASLIAKLLGNYPVFSLSENSENFPVKNVFFFLSNNHIFDFGKKGILRTVQFLEEENKAHQSVDLVDGVIVEVPVANQGRILIYNCNLVNPSKYGVNVNIYNHRYGSFPFSIRDVNRALQNVEYSDVLAVIGFPHLGKCGRDNFSPHDFAQLTSLRQYIPNSIPHIVLGHHSHQNGKTHYLPESNQFLLYSLGNFIFEEVHGRFTDKYFYNYLAEVDVQSGRIDITLHKIYSDDQEIRLVSDNEKSYYPTDNIEQISL